MRRLRGPTGRRYTPVFYVRQMYEPSSFFTRAQIARVLETLDRNRFSVCFTGHRFMTSKDLPMIVERLDQLLEICYQRGYRDFLCGGALGFDTLVAEHVISLRKKHADVRLVFVLPCPVQVKFWSEKQAQHYERLLYAANDIRVLSETYFDGCMQVRNRYMVDHSSMCICYCRHAKSGTASTVSYAFKKQLPVLNTAMEDVCAAFPTN